MGPTWTRICIEGVDYGVGCMNAVDLSYFYILLSSEKVDLPPYSPHRHLSRIILKTYYKTSSCRLMAMLSKPPPSTIILCMIIFVQELYKHLNDERLSK